MNKLTQPETEMQGKLLARLFTITTLSSAIFLRLLFSGEKMPRKTQLKPDKGQQKLFFSVKRKRDADETNDESELAADCPKEKKLEEKPQDDQIEINMSESEMEEVEMKVDEHFQREKEEEKKADDQVMDCEIQEDEMTLNENPDRENEEKEQTKDSRKFKEVWKTAHPWVEYNKKLQAIFCTVCMNANGKTSFAKGGSQNFRVCSLQDHEKSKEHKSAMCAKAEKKNKDKCKEKMSNMYNSAMGARVQVVNWLVKEDLPLTKYES